MEKNFDDCIIEFLEKEKNEVYYHITSQVTEQGICTMLK